MSGGGLVFEADGWSWLAGSDKGSCVSRSRINQLRDPGHPATDEVNRTAMTGRFVKNSLYDAKPLRLEVCQG